jgi:thioredoxin
MTVIELDSDASFGDRLSEAGPKLVVVDFFATWCGPCNMIAPFYKQLSTKYPEAMFLKVDVDKCPGTAAANNVSAMPTFVFLKSRQEVDRARGADKAQLENKVKQHYSSAGPGGASSGGAEGEAAANSVGCEGGDFIDLATLINKAQSECLNQSDDHTWEHALSSDQKTYLESDVDEQIILNVTFQQSVKINSLIITGPEINGPKDVKIFINQTRTIDFDTAESSMSVQTLELKQDDIKPNTVTKLRFVKFQNVQSITLFFVNNQSSSETTVVNYIKFIGAPLATTNMQDFKRVSGQAGEAHG